jgi:hypothetical protein
VSDEKVYFQPLKAALLSHPLLSPDSYTKTFDNQRCFLKIAALRQEESMADFEADF